MHSLTLRNYCRLIKAAKMSKSKDSGILLREDFDAGPSNLDEIEPGLWLGKYEHLTKQTQIIIH